MNQVIYADQDMHPIFYTFLLLKLHIKFLTVEKYKQLNTLYDKRLHIPHLLTNKHLLSSLLYLYELQ